jgi:hypothetical protein
VLSDGEAERIVTQAEAADRGTLLRWVRELLKDRRERSGLLLRLARELAYTRRRLRQAAGYLDGLLRRAEEDSHAPWPGKHPCPHCGAPTVLAGSEPQKEGGQLLVHKHPDGVRCEGRPPAREKEPRSS